MKSKDLVVGRTYEFVSPVGSLALFIRKEPGSETDYYYFSEHGKVVCLSDHHVKVGVREAVNENR